MKKFITLMLSASLVLGTLLTSCGGTAGNDETTPSESTSANTNSGDTSADTDADTSADTSAADTTAPENTTAADALRASFLEKADEVVVNDDLETAVAQTLALMERYEAASPAGE